MERYSGLTECLARLGAVWSMPLLWSSVKDFAALLGYSHVVAVDGARVVAGVSNAIIYADAPRQLFASIDRELVYAQHPFVQKALQSSNPFLVSELRRQPEHAGQRWTELLADVVKSGEGLIVPVYSGTQAKAGFTFGGEKPDTSAVARSMLQVVAHAAIERIEELGSGRAPAQLPSLSVREAQCLRWVAVGRADAEIGQILGISPRTVRFHVDSAKTKLGVTTRIQAVAKALRERVIAV
jgi:DNA-binding CsgD family transcriptional regulator